MDGASGHQVGYRASLVTPNPAAFPTGFVTSSENKDPGTVCILGEILEISAQNGEDTS